MNEVTFAAAVATRFQGPLFVAPRSISKPSSLLELSDQSSAIWLDEIAVAERVLGAAGGVAGVGVAVAVGGTVVGVGVEVGVVGVAVGVAVEVGLGVEVRVEVGVGVGVEVGGIDVGV